MPRLQKMKTENYVGRRMLHLWYLDDGNEGQRWFEGKILTDLGNGLYEVMYENDPSIYEVPLLEDLAKREVVLLD